MTVACHQAISHYRHLQQCTLRGIQDREKLDTGPVIIPNLESICSQQDNGIESKPIISFVTPQLILRHTLARFSLYSILLLVCTPAGR